MNSIGERPVREGDEHPKSCGSAQNSMKPVFEIALNGTFSQYLFLQTAPRGEVLKAGLLVMQPPHRESDTMNLSVKCLYQVYPDIWKRVSL